MNKNNFLLILFLLIITTFTCQVEDSSINIVDAYSELYNAIEYKYKECGNKPETNLIPPNQVSRDALKLCTLLILRRECPFDEYPISCYDMYWGLFTE